MKFTFPHFSRLYFSLVLMHLAAIVAGIPFAAASTKVLLMPVLMAAVAVCASSSFSNRWLLAGLLFSWLGDCLLISGQRPGFFIGGLSAFLTAHLLYIICFRKISGSPGMARTVKKQFLPLIAVAAFAVLMYVSLFPNLGAMAVPVGFYTLVISVMLGMAILVGGIFQSPAGKGLVSGAALFILSDSLLAWNKFNEPIPLEGLLIMSTYCLAQWLIARSVLRFTVEGQSGDL